MVDRLGDLATEELCKEEVSPFTGYAVDQDDTALIRVWATARGQRAAVVSRLPDAASQDRLRLADALTSLSGALWRCYTHPASAAGSLEPNTDGWRRQQTREGFPEVVPVIRKPNLPDQDGWLDVSYDRSRNAPIASAEHCTSSAIPISSTWSAPMSPRNLRPWKRRNEENSTDEPSKPSC